MIVELHMIQNFAPANLNRDDTGAPKDAEFGGYRRARISSQCLKRSVRRYMSEQGLIPAEDLGVRTKRLRQEVLSQVLAKRNDEAAASAVVDAALSAMGFPPGDEGKSQYLLFVGQREIAAMSRLCLDHWGVLSQATAPAADAKAGKQAKKAAKGAIPAEIQEAFVSTLDGGKARDVALFGRMVADLPGKRVDAACQVAHALSTHQVNMEFDYYTAVDDLQPDDATGADMIGDVQFNSACFYRYSNIDVEQLVRNLDGDRAAATETVAAFLRSSVAAIPTGKQNSMAALNPPSLVLAVVRRTGAWSLANAFVEPVKTMKDAGLVGGSIRALDEYWAKLTAMYGSDALVRGWACTTDGQAVSALGQDPLALVPSVPTLVQAVTACLQGQ